MTQWWHDEIHSVVSLYPVSLCSDYLRPQSLPRFCPASVEAAMTYIRLAGPAQAVLPASRQRHRSGSSLHSVTYQRTKPFCCEVRSSSLALQLGGRGGPRVRNIRGAGRRPGRQDQALTTQQVRVRRCRQVVAAAL